MNRNLSSVPKEKKKQDRENHEELYKEDSEKEKQRDRDRECFRKFYKALSLALIL